MPIQAIVMPIVPAGDYRTYAQLSPSPLIPGFWLQVMGNYSEKKWKYLSFALMGVLAVGLLAPQANAASKEIHQQIIDILNLNIKPNTDKIPTVDANVGAIKSKTDSLPSDPASSTAINNAELAIGTAKSVRVVKFDDPADGEVHTFALIPQVEGKTFSGSAIIQLFVPPGSGINIFCNLPQVSTFLASVTGTKPVAFDFTCESIDAEVYDINDGAEAGQDGLRGIIQYTVSSDITDVK